jgi:hypothetical protein
MSDANALALAEEFRELGMSPEDIVRKFRKYAGTTNEFRGVAGP